LETVYLVYSVIGYYSLLTKLNIGQGKKILVCVGIKLSGFILIIFFFLPGKRSDEKRKE